MKYPRVQCWWCGKLVCVTLGNALISHTEKRLADRTLLKCPASGKPAYLDKRAAKIVESLKPSRKSESISHQKTNRTSKPVSI